MLKDLLVRTKPRETSGSRASNRFEFQKSWALCRLIELHQTRQDYLIVFDYHEDVLVLDSSSDPKTIDFYQIKSKKHGNWTATALVTREKGENGLLSSPLGKMLANQLTFPQHTGSMSFVSNAGFRVSVKGKADSVVQEVCCGELTDDEVKKIVKALRDEHNLPADPDCIDCMYLANTALSIEGHDDHAMGVLGRYLAELYPGEKIHLPEIYRTLADEIKRKTNAERLPETFEGLRTERAISKEGFARILVDVRPQSRFNESLADAIGYLRAEGLGFEEANAIRRACQTYEIERMTAADSVLREARTVIETAVQDRRGQGGIPVRLTDALSVLREQVHRQTQLLVMLKSEHYRTAVILMAIYDI